MTGAARAYIRIVEAVGRVVGRIAMLLISFVMLLAINTASVQLVPPVLLLALMGLQINQLIFAIWITTGASLIIAITAAKLFGRLPKSRASDPNRLIDETEKPRDEGDPPPLDA